MGINQYRKLLEQKKGQQQAIQKSIQELNQTLSFLQSEQKNIEKAQIIIQQVAKETQAQLEFHISDIVSLALSTVFNSPYEFKVLFETKRNQTECKLYFLNGEDEIDPITATGGGVIDIVSFALRIAIYTLSNVEKQNIRNTIILDEPFKFVSKNLLPSVGELLKELNKKLNIQFIIITHLDELIEYGDQIFYISQKNNITTTNKERRS